MKGGHDHGHSHGGHSHGHAHEHASSAVVKKTTKKSDDEEDTTKEKISERKVSFDENDTSSGKNGEDDEEFGTSFALSFPCFFSLFSKGISRCIFCRKLNFLETFLKTKYVFFLHQINQSINNKTNALIMTHNNV